LSVRTILASTLRLPSGNWESIAAILASPFIGSFLGVLIRRLPEGHPVAIGRSRCDGCGAALAPGDLVPLLSYAVLRGRCRHCGGIISGFYPGVELAAMAVALLAALLSPPDEVWIDCVLGWMLLTVTWIDLRNRLLPDALTLPLIAAGMAQAWLFEDDLLDSLIGAAAGYLIIWGLLTLYRRLRGRDDIGIGDAKLFAAAGAWLGWESLPLVLLTAALTALAAAGIAHMTGRRRRGGAQIPFGPFLAAAIWGIRLLIQSDLGHLQLPA
jgi:leader peptidase (prepilin peptidase)/N-methyltransferase